MDEINTIVTALEKRISNTDSTYEWDDLMSVPFNDARAEAARQLCWMIQDAFPPGEKQNQCFCSDEGMEVFKSILKGLRQNQIK